MDESVSDVTDVVVVGASAGGVEALRALVAGLPPDLPAAIVVVLHIARDAPSALSRILDRAGALPAVEAEHGAALRNGTVYVAPADRHVLVEDGRLLLSAGPTENGHRPAIDPLFRSAALAYGGRSVGVVLSGTRDDGAAGLAAIVARRGTAFVQDLSEALYPAMPFHALEAVPGARALPAAKLGGEIADEIARAGHRPGEPPDELLVAETRIATMEPDATDTSRFGAATPSPYSCPACDGVLFEMPGHPAPRFRCRIGHAWSPASLDAEQADAVDTALWTALRVLQERSATLRKLAERADVRGQDRAAVRYRDHADRVDADAAAVRRLVTGSAS
jgi:two-component system, chemotaxis family, protein-glutamate methylesterase/glutaminase